MNEKTPEPKQIKFRLDWENIFYQKIRFQYFGSLIPVSSIVVFIVFIVLLFYYLEPVNEISKYMYLLTHIHLLQVKSQ